MDQDIITLFVSPAMTGKFGCGLGIGGTNPANPRNVRRLFGAGVFHKPPTLLTSKFCTSHLLLEVNERSVQ